MLGGAYDAHPMALPEAVDRADEPAPSKGDRTRARLLDLASLAALRGELADELRAAQHGGEVRDDIDADDLARGLETIVLTLLMGHVQAGPVDDARVRGIVAVFRAALETPPD